MLSSRLPKDLSPSPFFAELERAKADVLAECALNWNAPRPMFLQSAPKQTRFRLST